MDALGNKIWADLMELITSCAGLLTGVRCRTRVFLFPLVTNSLHLYDLFVSQRLPGLNLFVGFLATFWAPFSPVTALLQHSGPQVSSLHIAKGYALANELLDAMVALPFRELFWKISTVIVVH